MKQTKNCYTCDVEFFRVFLNLPIYENLLCYTLNPLEAYKIDPAPDRYLISGPEQAAELTAGIYYFTQLRKEHTENNELLELAIELQKEALWNRLKLEDKLYLRTFFEDGSPVTQFWRPVLS